MDRDFVLPYNSGKIHKGEIDVPRVNSFGLRNPFSGIAPLICDCFPERQTRYLHEKGNSNMQACNNL
jgi:hypothetical protein